LQLISIDPALFDGYAASPDFIQNLHFPGGMLIHEPRFAAIAGSHHSAGKIAPATLGLCGDAEALAAALTTPRSSAGVWMASATSSSASGAIT
jgi:hypothetical protein